MIKVYFDQSPMQKGHAVRGIGYYTKNLYEELEKSDLIKLVPDENEADLIHLPYFDFFFNTLKISNKPTVITIYDTIPLLYPAQYPPGIKGKINFLKQKKELKKCSSIITISETSKKDIVRFLDIPAYKIHPIHLSPSSSFKKLKIGKWKDEVISKYNLPQKYILYVGDVNYNKNLSSLIQACLEVKIPLVIIGKQAAFTIKDFDLHHKENEQLKYILEKYGDNKDIIRLGYVPQEDLVKIYNLALCYCQPSYYEGFGLPILEAFACGTPVIASKNQAHMEIAEGAALFSGVSSNELAISLEKVVSNKKLRDMLSEKGSKKIGQYSWEKTAENTINIYKKYA